jgi:hypothetical protein
MLDEQEQNDGEEKESKALTFERMVQGITYLGFLPLNKTPEGIDRELCDDMWILLQGEERGGVTWDTLKVVLLNMLGVRDPSRERAPKES